MTIRPFQTWGTFRRPVSVVWLGLLWAALPLSAQTVRSDLDLDEVLSLARERNPRLHALEAAAAAANLREPEASTLPDPAFQMGVMNFGIPDFNADMAMSMAPSVQLMQMVPFPGKLSLAGDVARIDAEMVAASADEAWWEVRGRASDLFYDLYSIDRRLEVMRETLLLLGDFQEIAKAMYAAGTGRQADVLRADVEVARMDGEIRRLEAMRTATTARLNAVLDRPPEMPLGSPRLGNLPLELPDAPTLQSWARETRPVLLGARLSVTQAGTRRELAGRSIWPDFTIGLSYGQRDRGLGTERMGSAMVGFTLPIHAGSRQHARRDEAAALERLAEAELAARRAEVNARIGELLAELERARSLGELYRDEVIPEARATVESALSSYRVGTVDFMTLVDAQMTVNRYETELHTLVADYGRAIGALESAVGRAMPRMGPLLSETP